MAILTNEQIVYLLRKTTLTRSEIGNLSPIQAVAILNEVYLQESQEIYREQHNLANLLAAIYNTIPRSRGGKVFHASDFLNSSMPGRETDKKVDELQDKASKKGIKLPSK